MLRSFADLGQRGVTGSFFASADGKGPVQETILLAGRGQRAERQEQASSETRQRVQRLPGRLSGGSQRLARIASMLTWTSGAPMLPCASITCPSRVLVGRRGRRQRRAGNRRQASYLELKPGIPYRFTLDLQNLNGGEARLLVQGETLPKDRLSQLTLYPSAAMRGAEQRPVCCWPRRCSLPKAWA